MAKKLLSVVNALLATRRRRIALHTLLDPLVTKNPRRVTLIGKGRFGYSGNLRLVAEALAARGDYEVHLFCESDLPTSHVSALASAGIRFHRHLSRQATHALLSSGVLIVDHSIRDGYIARRHPNRRVINIWHGVPIKNIELCMPHTSGRRRRLIVKNSSLYDTMIASSAADRDAIAKSFGVPPERVHVTGLPRYDLFRDQELSQDLQADLAKIHELRRGRRLVLFAPTFRERGLSAFAQLTEEDWGQLVACLQRHDAVLGLRRHPYDEPPAHPATDRIIDLHPDTMPETNLVLRVTDLLITDFSSLWVDFLLRHRPILGYAKDREHYTENERGFVHRFEEVFPGHFAQSVPELIAELDKALGAPEPEMRYERQLALFHTVATRRSSDAVADLVRQSVEDLSSP